MKLVGCLVVVGGLALFSLTLAKTHRHALFVAMAGLTLFLVGCVLGPQRVEKEPPVNTRIHREEDRVWLEGVKGWSFGDRQSSVHAAQEAVMRAAGEDVTYDYLVGVSSLAFRMQVSKTGLCPSSPHSFCGYQCVARSTQSLPRNVTIFEVKPEDAAKVKEARQAVVDSIENGIPVQYGSEEDGVIIGYQKGGEEWICLHPMRDRGTKSFVETAWPWGIAVYTDRKQQMPSERALAVAALEQAVKMVNTEESGNYFVGFKAWDVYVQRVKELDQADDKTRQEAMLGNAWIYECLAQYRGVAARYLRDVARQFNAEAAQHLRNAADRYEKMSSEVLRDKDHTSFIIAPYPPGPYPWSLKEGETWTREMRAEQIKRLDTALPLEREAIQEIEKALALISAR